jgi:ankyrin repeat protein
MPNNKKKKNGKKKQLAGTDVARSAFEATRDLLKACLDKRDGTTLKKVQDCVANGANVNAKLEDLNPLDLCASWGDSACEIIAVLLEAGADITNSALIYALSKNGITCVKLLLQADADANARGEKGGTALHTAAEVNGDHNIVDLLLKAGAEIDAKDITFRTPLHVAAFVDNKKCIEVLIKAGADVSVKGTNDYTPLYLACKKGYSDCVELLLKAGADKNAKDKVSNTPLQVAAAMGAIQCVELLLNAGVDKDAMNHTGITALMYATMSYELECVNLLVKAGCDVDNVNDDGQCALDVSVSFNLIDVARIFVLAGANVKEVNDVNNTAYKSTLSEDQLAKFNEVRNSDEMQAVLRLSAPPQPRCNQCGATSTTRDDGTPRRPMKCAGCRRARFCNAECQRAAWNRHKPVCGKRADVDAAKSSTK